MKLFGNRKKVAGKHRDSSRSWYLQPVIELIAAPLLLTAITLAAIPSGAQVHQEEPRLYRDEEASIRTLGSLPAIIKEASGLEMSASGTLWTHNDDRLPILYGLDSLGNILRTIHLNHPNHGWEDLARDQHGNLYIGAFGNNRNDRKDLAIYKIDDPDRISDQVINAGIISFSYSDQRAFPPGEQQMNFDVDAFISIGDSLYLFTKNRTKPFTGYSKVYRLSQTPGKHTAVLHDSLFLGNGSMLNHWVTGADISPDGRWIALLSHDCLWMINGYQNNRFSSGKIFKIPLKHFSHKAGVCFSGDREILIVDELEFGVLGGRIYSFDLSRFFGFTEKGVESIRGPGLQRP